METDKKLYKCIICKWDYEKRNSIQKTCSYECSKANKSLKDKELRQKRKEKLWYNKTTIYNSKCWKCWIIFETINKRQKFCWRKCMSDHYSDIRNWENNPAYRNWNYPKKRDPQKSYITFWFGEKEFLRNSKIIRKKQIDNLWYSYCEHCSTSNSLRFETHHIIYRSEAPKHKNLHNTRNLIRLCIRCHNDFHSKKIDRWYLVKERKLWELFETLHSLQQYNDN